MILSETKIDPIVDLYITSLYNAIGLPRELFAPIFAIHRTVGWTSHTLEQLSNNRLIRPRAKYTGFTDFTYIPTEERSSGKGIPIPLPPATGSRTTYRLPPA